jgi:hypothetical protein
MIENFSTYETTIIVPAIDDNVARYDLMVATSFSSRVYTSLLNLFRILPIGVAINGVKKE